MDYYLSEQQIEELVNFDHVYQDLEDLIEDEQDFNMKEYLNSCLLYTSPSPRDLSTPRMPSSA